MKLIRLLTFFLYFVSAMYLSASPPLRLAIHNIGEPIQWDSIGHFVENKNPPLLMISIPFPWDRETKRADFPSPYIPVLLQLEVPPEPGTLSQKNLDTLSQLLTASYFDGLRLDRFSAYKFGFFNELNMHGYMSGVVQATRAFLFNLSYGYSLGKAFRLELFYDSTWITNPFNNYHNTYFSGAAISGTINVPGLNGILRFEAGMPVINNGIKGIVVYFVLLKMF